jgi:serine/threonine protein phosphatase PrpC
MLNIAIAARTEVGARSHNEDDLKHGSNGAYSYVVLSDGAGGHRGGAIASDLVVRMLALRLQSCARVSPQMLSDFVHEAHGALGEKQLGRKSHDRMHATLVALWIDAHREHALWTHVGDSRLYLLRHGRVRHVTRDDSVVQQLVDAGYLAPDEARAHPHKNQLLIAMGGNDPVEPHTVGEPMPIKDGDAFLLCSDGWWDALDLDAIEATLAQARCVDEWLDLMRARVREAAQPDQDNYSAVAVWVGDPTQSTRIGDP